MGVSKMLGLYKGKSHLEIDHLGVALFQETSTLLIKKNS